MDIITPPNTHSTIIEEAPEASKYFTVVKVICLNFVRHLKVKVRNSTMLRTSRLSRQ